MMRPAGKLLSLMFLPHFEPFRGIGNLCQLNVQGSKNVLYASFGAKLNIMILIQLPVKFNLFLQQLSNI